MVVPVRHGRRDQSLLGAGKLRSNLVVTWSEQECRILSVLCVQQNRHSYRPREELEAALDSICKHVKELGALHVAESDVGGDFLAWAFGEIGECIQ